jgi:hypothetical protein
MWIISKNLVKYFTQYPGILTHSLTIYIIFQEILRNFQGFEVNLRNFKLIKDVFKEIYIILTYYSLTSSKKNNEFQPI